MVVKSSKGFTLIEIIIVIVILGIVSGITVKFLIDSLRIYKMTINQKTLLDEGKLALERMCRDIRDARSLTTPGVGGSGNTIRFTRDNVTAQDYAGEDIRFIWSGTPGAPLRKRKSQPSVTLTDLASNVSAFTASRAASNEITLNLTLLLASGERVTLRTRVYPKNLLEDTVPGPNPTYKNFFYCWEELRG